MAVVEINRAPRETAAPYQYERSAAFGVTPRQEWRAREHSRLLDRTIGVSGAIAECGVFQGTSFMRFAKWRSVEAPDRQLIGFDMFGDFPREVEADEIDATTAFIMHSGGGRGISPEELLIAMDDLNVLNHNDQLVQGDLVETAPQFLEEHPDTRFSFLHIDVDLESPTSAALQYLAPRVSSGGIILFDDMGSHWPGATRAVSGWAQQHGHILNRIDYPRDPASRSLHYVQVG